MPICLYYYDILNSKYMHVRNQNNSIILIIIPTYNSTTEMPLVVILTIFQ